MPHQPVPESVLAQAAATLAAGALSASDPMHIRPGARDLGDYALQVFWHIYEEMRHGGGVERERT
jgi:hypothetical protein